MSANRQRTIFLNFLNFLRDSRKETDKELYKLISKLKYLDTEYEDDKKREGAFDELEDKILRFEYLTWFEGYLTAQFEEKFK
jgi:uncharacterized coiled-coil DUF342 family protein